MKNLCVLGFITISSLTQAQQGAIFHAGTGTSTAAKWIVDMGFGYQYKGVLIEGSINVPPLDNQTDHAAYFPLHGGYEIKFGDWSVTGLAGAAYRLKSTDKKQLNGFVASVGCRIKFKDVYVGFQNMDRVNFFTVGLSGMIKKDY